MTQAKKILRARKDYAAREWSTFPVPFGTKRSHIAGRAKGGVAWGSTKDPKIFEAWAKRWPDSGIGLPTGAENGIWVLEIDTPKGHGVDGPAELRKLCTVHGQLPATLTAQSPSGSLHYYFRHPGRKVFNSAGALAPGC